MRCKGNYTRGFFHNWGKWETQQKPVVTEFFVGSSAIGPASSHKRNGWELFNLRTCSRCGKTKGKKIA